MRVGVACNTAVKFESDIASSSSVGCLAIDGVARFTGQFRVAALQWVAGQVVVEVLRIQRTDVDVCPTMLAVAGTALAIEGSMEPNFPCHHLLNRVVTIDTRG